MGESYEGGIHTPMIAFWPRGIKTKLGGFDKQVGHVMDFMGTFVELPGATYPRIYEGHPIPTTTGISLTPTFRGERSPGHEDLFNEHFGARYAREGDWKLLSSGSDSSWRLFNLADDRTEGSDLAAKYPAQVQHLDSLWRQWARTRFVFPKPGPKRPSTNS